MALTEALKVVFGTILIILMMICVFVFNLVLALSFIGLLLYMAADSSELFGMETLSYLVKSVYGK